MYGRYYPRHRAVGELVELVGLTGKERHRVKLLSGGQRRRLDLALALVGDPDLLFLDEPTTGFDPSARRQAWSTIKDLCALGKTVFLTTHYMDEAQALADRVAVMVDGRIVALGTPAEIGGRDTAPTQIAFALPARVGLGELPSLDGADVTEPAPGHVRVITREGLRSAHALTGWALERGHELRGFAVSQPSLEDIYLRLTDTQETTSR
jgi:ABC-2 type transport system ATP-binding protein